MARIIAGLAARTYAQFIGLGSKNQFGLNLPLPPGSALGDFCVIVVVANATISTSGGAAWSTIGPTANHRVYYRQLAAPDLVTGAIVQSANAAAAWGVWRGPLQLSAQRSSLTWTTPNPNSAPGFVKSLNAIAIIGLGDGANIGGGANTAPSFIVKGSGGQFDNSVQGINTGGDVGVGMGEIHLIDNYVNGTAFPVTSLNANTKTTEYYELLG